MIRVLLADDQQLVRTGFRVLLEASGQVEVVGEAADGAQAVALAAELRPQVVLMDIRMPGTDGLAATEAITSDPSLAGVRIIMLTTYQEDEQVFTALRMGASGYLVKDTGTEELLHAIEVPAARTDTTKASREPQAPPQGSRLYTLIAGIRGQAGEPAEGGASRSSPPRGRAISSAVISMTPRQQQPGGYAGQDVLPP